VYAEESELAPKLISALIAPCKNLRKTVFGYNYCERTSKKDGCVSVKPELVGVGSGDGVAFVVISTPRHDVYGQK